MAAQTPPEQHGRILHVSMDVAGQTIAGADAPPQYFSQPQGFSVTLGLKDVGEAERIFNTLAEGGVVRMPLGKTFWAERFGMLIDRFGTPWMINCGSPG